VAPTANLNGVDKENNSVTILGIEPSFLGIPTNILVTVLTELSNFQ
jgi:hypothetical protein